MADKTHRKLVWYESDYDRGQIDEKGWHFNIALQVASGSAASKSNVVWRSENLAPKIGIEWNVKYALNWTLKLPPGNGATVTYEGDWQECAKGDSYDLDRLGGWTSGSKPGKPDWLSVGDTKYPKAVHFVVGIYNPGNDDYDVIFIDDTSLPPNSSAVYQPQEMARWWLDSNLNKGSVYSQTQGAVAAWDFTKASPKTNKWEWWTTYTVDDGEWSIQDKAPKKFLLYGVPDISSLNEPKTPTLISPLIFGWLVRFARPIVDRNRENLRKHMSTKMQKYFNNVKVEWVTKEGNKLSITYESKKNANRGTIAAIGFLQGTIDPARENIEASLMEEQAEGDISADNTWTISEDDSEDTPEVDQVITGDDN